MLHLPIWQELTCFLRFEYGPVSRLLKWESHRRGGRLMSCLRAILKSLFTSSWIYGVHLYGNFEHIVEVVADSNPLRPPKIGQVLGEPLGRF